MTDYWRVNDRLHFITIEEGGTKSVPHTVPFGELDVQRTTDANAAQGFRFGQETNRSSNGSSIRAAQTRQGTSE